MPFLCDDMAKEWAKSFYNSKAWKDTREIVLKRDRYRCQSPGCRRTAEEVHHIKELTEKNVYDIRISLNLNNLTSLCSNCHKRITKQMKSKTSVILEEIIFDENGYPIPAQAPPEGCIEK